MMGNLKVTFKHDLTVELKGMRVRLKEVAANGYRAYSKIYFFDNSVVFPMLDLTDEIEEVVLDTHEQGPQKLNPRKKLLHIKRGEAKRVKQFLGTIRTYDCLVLNKKLFQEIVSDGSFAFPEDKFVLVYETDDESGIDEVECLSPVLLFNNIETVKK